MFDKEIWLKQAEIVADVLAKAPEIDKDFRIPSEEFINRQKKVWEMLKAEGVDCGVVYSDQHYCGDVPYLAGDNNIIVEPIAAVLGENGLYFIAGLEAGIVAEQFCHRSGVKIRKVDLVNVANENYPGDLLRPETIIEEACGKKPKNIALLTTKGVFPVALFSCLENMVGRENIIDLSKKYYRIKYAKSDVEMRLIEESTKIADVMVEGMLRILRPGLTETQVAQWGYAIARELGAEDLGFDVMVTTGKNNKTIVAKASNAVIHEGDIVHIGASPKRDGLCGAARVSVMCVKSPDQVTEHYKVYMDFLEKAYLYSVEVFEKIAKENLKACEHEKAMIEFYRDHTSEMEEKLGFKISNFETLKGYVTSHNTGYTECQEFYGALACDFDEYCEDQMAIMLDAGLKGFYDTWDEIALPDLDYIVLERTVGKFGNKIRVFNSLPLNVQEFVGEAF